MLKNLLAKILKPMQLYDQLEEPRRIIVMLIIVAPLIFLIALTHYPTNLVPLIILYIILMYRIIYLYTMI